MDVEIRKVLLEEVPQYRELRLRGLQEHPDAFGETADGFSKKSLDDLKEKLLLSEQNGGFILGAFIDGKMIGTVALGRETGQKSKHRAGLWGMYILPDFRGNKIGQRLIGDLIDRAKNISELKQIHLGVAVNNSPALKLYELLGFKIYGTDPRVLRVESKYYDEYLMVLILDAG